METPKHTPGPLIIRHREEWMAAEIERLKEENEMKDILIAKQSDKMEGLFSTITRLRALLKRAGEVLGRADNALVSSDTQTITDSRGEARQLLTDIEKEGL